MVKHVASAVGWAVIGIGALLPRAEAGRPLNLSFVNRPVGLAEESFYDESTLELLPARPQAIQRESMLETPFPVASSRVVDPPPRKRSLLTATVDPFLLVFSGSASVLYDDNIFLAQQDEEPDFLTTLTPRVAIGAGDYAERKKTFLAAGFAPSFIHFEDHNDLSGVEYDTFVEGQYSFSKLKLGSRVSYQKLSGNDQDASGRVNRELYIADFLAEYALSQITLVEVHGQFTHRDYRQQIDSDEYLYRAFLARLISQKLQAALGGTVGMFRPANQQNQNYEELLLRLWYQPSPKLAIRAIGGVDFRQFNEGIEARQTPVANVGLVYLASPAEHTILSVDGYRRVQNSVSDPTQNYISNGLVFRVTQRVWRDLYLDLGTGYQRTAYYSVERAPVIPRKENFYFIRPAIRYNLNNWGTLSMFFSWRNNDSTVAGGSWKSEQIGVELAVGF